MFPRSEIYIYKLLKMDSAANSEHMSHSFFPQLNTKPNFSAPLTKCMTQNVCGKMSQTHQIHTMSTALSHTHSQNFVKGYASQVFQTACGCLSAKNTK